MAFVFFRSASERIKCIDTRGLKVCTIPQIGEGAQNSKRISKEVPIWLQQT